MSSHETWIELLRDPDHVAFELILELLTWAVTWYPRKIVRDYRQLRHDREVHGHGSTLPESAA